MLINYENEAVKMNLYFFPIPRLSRMARPRKEDPGSPISVRIPDSLMDQLKLAAKLTAPAMQQKA